MSRIRQSGTEEAPASHGAAAGASQFRLPPPAPRDADGVASTNRLACYSVSWISQGLRGQRVLKLRTGHDAIRFPKTMGVVKVTVEKAGRLS